MLITVSVVMMLQIWRLGFSLFLLPVDVTVCGKFDLTRMFLKFEGFLYAQIGVTSNGCLYIYILAATNKIHYPESTMCMQNMIKACTICAQLA